MSTNNEALEQASNELWEKMGNEDFTYQDFMNTCEEYDIDEDDLIFSLI